MVNPKMKFEIQWDDTFDIFIYTLADNENVLYVCIRIGLC